jgi:hypothetical protein
MSLEDLNAPWHLIETPTLLEIRPDLGGKPGGVAVSIGSARLSFRPRRTGTRRGETMRYREFGEPDRALARLIVRAVNAHHALLSALERLIALNNCNYDRQTEDYRRAMAEANAAVAKARP